ncbi:MAG TPA: DinB family protein [Pyrinomonadaceae bacterium]|jgi:uncharacterized damage-inducible protein DinB|nr:DinB family protein [Pyrinomonadaceae bacterium]
MSRYDFLVETYRTERIKTLSVWSQFDDDDMEFRPEARARTPHEHMVHQCVSEDNWMKNMLGIDIDEPTLPPVESKIEFIKWYARVAQIRLSELRSKSDDWFEELTQFFELSRTRAWILTRRIAHTSHHRGQLTAYLRVLGKNLYSTYGPSADTGGLPQNRAHVVYRYSSIDELLTEEQRGGKSPELPGPGSNKPTERPNE